MDRAERSEGKELFGAVTPATAVTDPDFQNILNRLIFGAVFPG